MKKIYILFFIVLTTLLFASCTNGYDKMNIPDSGLTDEEGERDAYFLGQHFNVMQQSVIALDAAQSQYTEQLLAGPYGGYFSDARPFSAPFSTYAPESGWTQSSFNYATGDPMSSYRKIKTMTTDPTLLAVSKVLKVMVLSKITDTYGPIPYASLEDDGQLTASYDPQDVVYKDMIADLDEAIELFTANRSESFSSNADLYYNGKVENWAKLANSMKLRLAIRMANIEPALAKKIAEEVIANPVGAMSTNADNANLPIQSGQTNPYAVGMIEWNGGDSRISADITTYMNGYNDPRRAAYFDPTKIAGYENDYIGYRNGVDIANQKIAQTYSNISTGFLAKSSYVIMAASEVAFLKAEGALRGWAMGGTAQEFYEQGITLSFDQWSVSGAANYIADGTSKVKPYVDPRGAFSFTGTPSSITIAWDNAGTGISSTNMERIITQKWIALFPNGIEAWSEFRRTGFPKLMPVLKNRSSVVSEERMARRLEFPQSEYTGNGANVAKAVTYLGGADNMATDLWWAKKN